ncbi:hypothetical protein, partial [Lacimonas salitolerans]
ITLPHNILCLKQMTGNQTTHTNREIAKIFSSFFPEDFDSIPKLIEDLSHEISASLKKGLTLSQARDISNRYDLKRFGFVVKTWLDRLAAEKRSLRDLCGLTRHASRRAACSCRSR